MAEAVDEKHSCAKCGSEVRDGTTFCYACGARVAPDETALENEAAVAVDEEASKSALDDLADKLSRDDKDERLAKAATERKKARVSQHKLREFVWEPRSETPKGLLVAVVAVFVLAVFAVVVTVVWK